MSSWKILNLPTSSWVKNHVIIGIVIKLNIAPTRGPTANEPIYLRFRRKTP